MSATTLSSVLVGVEPVDAVSLASGAVILIVVGALAAFLPSSRASRLRPMTALRIDAD